MNGPAWGQCAQLPPASDFTFTTLAPTSNVTGNAYDIVVAPDLKVYWVERAGAFKVYDPATTNITLLSNMSVLWSVGNFERAIEGGAEGVALDGNFSQNRWVYIRYSVPTNQLPAYTPNQLVPIERLSRFTLNASGLALVAGSEKVILEFRIFAQCCHYGGDLEWGPDGNLWMSTGDNNNPTYSNVNPSDPSFVYRDVRATAGNTNDIRGKVLRIRPIAFPDNQTPTPGIGSTYTIPAGNLRDYFGGTGYWSSAEQAMVRPEIYSMGHRNPFTIDINPTNNWLAIGEASGSSSANKDEINVITHPANGGWPFFSGMNTPYPPSTQPAASPMNTSTWNTGVQKLPPAFPAVIANGVAGQSLICFGIVQGWGRYDASLNSTVKWPPYLAGKLLFSSYGSVPLQVATLDTTGTVTRVETLFPSRLELTEIHRSTFGPDGALYIAVGQQTFTATTNSRIVKISYGGPCSSVVPVLRSGPKPGYAIRLVMNNRAGMAPLAYPEGSHRVSVRDLQGKLIWEHLRGSSETAVVIPSSVPPGLLRVVFQAR